MEIERDSLEYDVVVVGGGPAGLAAAIKLKQLCQANNQSISVCVLEKGSEIGAHILSGAVIEPKALEELFPDWKTLGAPLNTLATKDEFWYLTQSKYYKLPTPPQMHNKGNYIVSLGNVCRWLAEQAEQLGVDIFPGFPAADIIFDETGAVQGVITGDMGVDNNGQPTDQFQPGMKLLAKKTLFAEGCRGSLSKRLIAHFKLDKNAQPQTYGIGFKELWQLPEDKHSPGKIIHTIGWPLDTMTYGGSYIYYLENHQLSIGFVIGLDYQNPYLNTFKEFQRFKTHPSVARLLEGGERISYGARALNEGGFQSIPELSFPGGMILGASAGFMNVPKIKGSHTAMKSGIVAAETTFDHLCGTNQEDFRHNLANTWVWPELKKVRNIRPGFHKGLWFGLVNAAIDTYVFRGNAPWTLKHQSGDHLSLKPASESKRIEYPKPDGKVSFDLLSSVYLSNTNHEENQPCHLTLKDPSVALSHNLAKYDSPESRYCPAGVYEIVNNENNEPHLQINAQNCVHCKTCDIKDPTQNINWITPEGGGGPNYPNM